MVFYQPIKIPLSLICWLLVQAPGNRWKGAQKKGPEDMGGTVQGRGHLGQGERKRLRKPKICCRDVFFLPNLPPFRLLFLFYYMEQGESYSLVRPVHLIDSVDTLCLCLHIVGSESICYNTFIYSSQLIFM